MNPSIKFKILRQPYLDYSCQSTKASGHPKLEKRFSVIHSQRSSKSTAVGEAMYQIRVALPRVNSACRLIALCLEPFGQQMCSERVSTSKKPCLPPSLLSGVYLGLYCNISPFLPASLSLHPGNHCAERPWDSSVSVQ